jgi:hypothetical protein
MKRDGIENGNIKNERVMNKTERKEFMKEADRIIQKLANVLVEEVDQENSTALLLYVTAKFTAGLLLGLQEQTGEIDIAEQYTSSVKELMAILGKDMKIQAIKDKIKENEEEIARLKSKQDEVLRIMFNDSDNQLN